MSTEQTFDGGCLCGDVRYQVAGKPVIVAHCHCRDCMKATGAGHSTGAMFSEGNVRLEGTLAEYLSRSENGNTVSHLFCPRCGSKLFGRNTGMPGYLTVAAGTLDDPSWLEPEVTVFARNRCPWDNVDEEIPTYDAQPDWKPG